MDKIKNGDRVQILYGPTLTIGMIGTAERFKDGKWEILLSKEKTEFGLNYYARAHEHDLKKIGDQSKEGI